MLQVSDAGRAAILRLIAEAGLTLELYTNEQTPDASDTTRTYKVPTGGGYSSHRIPAKAWSFAKDGTLTAAEQVFTFTRPPKPNVIHGYFVRLGNILMWVEPFDIPFTVNQKGDTLVVVPTLSFSTE